MTKLTETLERFNRKERNWLLRDALGSGATKLNRAFLDRVAQSIGNPESPKVSIPDDAWWAIDYHLDWLIGALHVFEHQVEWQEVQSDTARLVEGHQQDIDLIIAFDTIVILVEVKGVGSWHNPGFARKMNRLAKLSTKFLDQDGKIGNVTAHFILCSPEKPPKLDLSAWPNWMKSHGEPRWMPLELAMNSDKLLVERCDEFGKKSNNSFHWRIKQDGRANRMIGNGSSA